MVSVPSIEPSGARLLRTLPARYYTDPAIFAEEKERIFYRHWQCIGHVCMAREPGDYFTAKIVDEEILVVRGEDRVLRAFYNVCRHRGHPLVGSSSGNRERFVCPYHAWTYRLDGTLLRAPCTEAVAGFDPSCIRLKEVSLQAYGPLVFVSLDEDAPPMEKFFGDVDKEMFAAKPSVDRQRLVIELGLPHDCNWKASVEGASECYHCPSVHRYLAENVMDIRSYHVAAEGMVQRVSCSGKKGNDSQRLWFLWPNTLVGFYPVPGFGATLCLRHMYPLDHEHTVYHYRWFADEGVPDGLVLEYAERHRQTTGAEDAAVASAVQRGLRSRGYEQGYVLDDPEGGWASEQAVAQFHTLVREALGRPEGVDR